MGRHKRSKTLIGVFVGLALAALAVVGATIIQSFTEAGINLARDSVRNEALSVQAQWPLLPGCDGATAVAMLESGPARDDIAVRPDSDVRVAMVSQGGGAFRLGHLTLDLTAADSRTAYVTGIDVNIFRVLDEPAAWSSSPAGGCGDSYERTFFVDLDAPTPYVEDLGITGNPEAVDGPAVPSAPFGRTFVITESEPARIIVHAASCGTSVEWGLDINYLISDQELSIPVGTVDDPLISLAGDLTEDSMPGPCPDFREWWSL